MVMIMFVLAILEKIKEAILTREARARIKLINTQLNKLKYAE